MDRRRTTIKKILLAILLTTFLWLSTSVITIPVYALEPTMLYQPDLASIPVGERLADELYREGNGFVSDGTGGLVSTTDNEYNAIYFGPTVRQFHYHAVMTPVTPNTPVVGGLSFKTFSYEDGKRMDLAVTAGTNDKRPDLRVRHVACGQSQREPGRTRRTRIIQFVRPRHDRFVRRSQLLCRLHQRDACHRDDSAD
ncbi:MAG: hypothetical protein MZU97_10625 [Bacillus subtilis]|nr:hypothetical protein [Bacillus subtilis]